VAKARGEERTRIDPGDAFLGEGGGRKSRGSSRLPSGMLSAGKGEGGREAVVPRRGSDIVGGKRRKRGRRNAC